MILWFAGLSLVAMWVVFRDPAIDHRLVVVGALLPDVLDGAIGQAAVGHSLAFAVALLFGVMGVTIGRRSLRRRVLAVPIGWFFHLVFDGVWSQTALFWWPLQGFDFPDVSVPAFDRPIGLVIVMEVVGLLTLAWAYRRFGLTDSARRTNFVRTGRIDRALTDPDRSSPKC